MLFFRFLSFSALGAIAIACSATTDTKGTFDPNQCRDTLCAGTGGSTGAGAAQGAGSSFGFAGAFNEVGNGGAPVDLGHIMEMDPNAADCAGIVSKGEQITVDIFIMFDQSASMTCAIPAGGDRWTAVKNALSQFVMDPGAAGINVGIQYFGNFGLLSSCNAMDYQTPDVEIGPLPMNAQPIVDSLNRHMANTNTPTPPALIGAVNHAIDWKNAHPGHSVVVALVTDGQPNACGAVADVVSAAGAGLMSTIPTYVIGVISPGTTCNLDPNPPNQQDLDAVAMAGGSGQALMVDVTQNTAMQFLDTMNKIRAKSQVPCQYALPKPPSGQMLDAGKVNVAYTPPGATMPATLLGVTMSTCDPVNGGWYYDNPAAPTKINLCPSTCMQVSQMTGGEITISVGCATKHPA